MPGDSLPIQLEPSCTEGNDFSTIKTCLKDVLMACVRADSLNFEGAAGSIF